MAMYPIVIALLSLIRLSVLICCFFAHINRLNVLYHSFLSQLLFVPFLSWLPVLFMLASYLKKERPLQHSCVHLRKLSLCQLLKILDCFFVFIQFFSRLSLQIGHLLLLFTQLLAHKLCKVFLFRYPLLFFLPFFFLSKSFLFLYHLIVFHPFLCFLCCRNPVRRWRMQCFSPSAIVLALRTDILRVHLSFVLFWRSQPETLDFSWLERLLFPLKLLLKFFV